MKHIPQFDLISIPGAVLRDRLQPEGDEFSANYNRPRDKALREKIKWVAVSF